MSLFGPPNIERMKAKRDVPGLIKALDYQKDREICLAAIKALGELKDARAVEPLFSAMKNPPMYDPIKPVQNELTQSAAGDALAEIGAPARKPLLTALATIPYSHENRVVKRIAAAALGKMSIRMNDAVLCAQAVEVLGQKVDERYSTGIDYNDQWARRDALLEIGPQAETLLSDTLKDQDPPSENLVRALGYLHDLLK